MKNPWQDSEASTFREKFIMSRIQDRRFDFLTCARVTQLPYPAEITPQEAEREIEKLASDGINTILTEGHRYIMYDLADPTHPPRFHFIPQRGEASIRATKLITDICHNHGIRVLHHVTCAYCTEDFMLSHRDWTQRDARFPEEPLFFEEYGGVWLLCLNNPEFREEFFRTVISITKKTGVDGWMIDEVEWLPTWFSCGCKWCREKFRKETGYELPSDADSPIWENFEDAVWRAWLRFRMKSSADFFADLKKKLDAETPGQVITTCHAGAGDTWLAQWWGMDIIDMSRALNYIFYEAYVRNGMPFYSWRRHLVELKLYSAVAHSSGYPPLTLFYPGSQEESNFCWAMCALSGHRFWACNERLRHFTKPFFPWQGAHESLFGRQEPLANVALLFSRQTRDSYKGRDTAFYINEWAGWAETLVEANIPFVVIIENDLLPKCLEKFSTLLLPNAVCLSESQLQVIMDYIAQGGKVILTAETGLRDETGAMRNDISIVLSLREKALYLPEMVGERHFIGYIRKGMEFIDRREDAAREMIVSAVRGLAGDLIPWEIEAPTGVVANSFRRDDGAVIFHVLNCSGAVLDNGVVITGNDYSLTFPEVRDVIIKLRREPGFNPKFGRLYNVGKAEFQQMPLNLKESYFFLQIPVLKDFAILEIKNTQT